MGSEFIGQYPDPERQRRRPFYDTSRTVPASDPASFDDDATQPLPPLKISPQDEDVYQEPSFREHVSGSLFVSPADAPYFHPAYQPYQQQPPASHAPGYANQASTQNYNNATPTVAARPPAQPTYGYPQAPYYQGYYGQQQYYPPYGYPYPWQPPQPVRRDGYLLGMAITSFAGSIIIFLGGLACLFIMLLIAVLPSASEIKPDQQFSAIVQFTAFTLAGLLGGGFCFYHSFRSLFLKRESADFRLPWFWTFLTLYGVVIVIATMMRTSGLAVSNIPFSTFMIALSGLMPALTFMALGVRRVHFPRSAPWPTTWRRFTLSLVSGATLAITLALVFELILTVFLVRQFGLRNVSLDDPNQPLPTDFQSVIALLILVSVIAPFVEEAVKPLGVVAIIGRINSAGEAFVLGLAAGIGFDLVETMGYIGMGYRDWLDVAIQRSSAGLLHGFGAAMVALGWYYLTHPEASKHRFLLALGCWCYAVIQHAIWNGSFLFQMLPSPIGPFLESGDVPLGPLSFPAFYLIYGSETLIMLILFLTVAKRVRSLPPASTNQRGEQPQAPFTQQPQYVGQAR